MWEQAQWLGVPAETAARLHIAEGDLTGRFAYFRLVFESHAEDTLTVRLTANSRYRMWVNGRPVLSGPCKGDLTRTYFDTVCLDPYLQDGRNVLAVQVLYNNAYGAVKQSDERAAIFGVLTPGGGHRLLAEGTLHAAAGETVCEITTGLAPWKVYLEGSCFLKSEGDTLNLGAVCEDVDFAQVPADWKNPDFDDTDWEPAVLLEPALQNAFEQSVGLVPRFSLTERPIPLLYETDDGFAEEVITSALPGTGILKTGSIFVPARTTQVFILDAGRIRNGFVRFRFSGGAGTHAAITYFEKFTAPGREIRRDDAENGSYTGITDTVILRGTDVVFEPFWYRTFRFVAVRIETAAEAVKVCAPLFRGTGYPLEKISEVHSADAWVGEVWDLCVHTLENCMMDTYMDCPYYEQMQFPMDTRLQILYTYLLSGDIRLARKAIADLHCSITPDGLVCGKYPSAYPQIISTFSLHYVFMLREYVRQTGDVSFVRQYLPDADRILNYYDSCIGADGLVGRLGWWEFVDWLPQWEDLQGAPAALAQGPSAIINLMYAYALEDAAQLYALAGRDGMAREYRGRRGAVLERIQETCWDPQRTLYREGPSFAQYTCHAQAWAVLNGLPDAETARSILTHAAQDPDVISCSFSTAYEWFRACEKAGVYDLTKASMRQWAALPGKGCTCCPETPENARSDCHAWSALPMYELIRCMAGIGPEGDGWARVRIAPHPGGLQNLHGKAATPKGTIVFDYERKPEDAGYECRLYLPAGLGGTFVRPDGSRENLAGGRQHLLQL